MRHEADAERRAAHVARGAEPQTGAARLVEIAVRTGEGVLAEGGALVVDTGTYTGRSPDDRFLVRDASSEARVDWGPVNQPMAPDSFDALRDDMLEEAARSRLYRQDLHVGADPAHQVPVRFLGERAWHALFVRHLFRRDGVAAGGGWTVLDLPSFRADPRRHGTRSATAIALDLARRWVLVAHTGYAGEVKKAVFGALNDWLPSRGVLPMHCSANHDEAGRGALFFGLSGTGKTTLSADATRTLVGDDEHGWSDDGVFNFEGGCYAKTHGLSPTAEPEIHGASTRFGTLLENVAIDPASRTLDFGDATRTENGRAAYPLDFLAHASRSGRAGHPRTVVFLTADAFGVVPPVARLDVPQAMYHFLSGYTAKVAGTERGVTEPRSTFSACFGAPFMPLPPPRYADMLGDRLRRHGVRTWWVNTGWTGGPHGIGRRISLAHTRAIVAAVVSGALDGAPSRRDPVFGVRVPLHVEGVPDAILDPRGTWGPAAGGGEAYDAQAQRLAAMFRDHFARFAPVVGDDVRRAGPVT